MPIIKLSPDQLGTFDSEGNFDKRPTRDILGAEITDLHGTIKRLRFNGVKYFVTIPPGKDSDANEYKLADDPKPADEPKPADPVIAPKLKG